VKFKPTLPPSELELARIEPYLPAREGTKPSPVILPTPPGDPDTWDFDRELYAEELPGWIGQWHINTN